MKHHRPQARLNWEREFDSARRTAVLRLRTAKFLGAGEASVGGYLGVVAELERQRADSLRQLGRRTAAHRAIDLAIAGY